MSEEATTVQGAPPKITPIRCTIESQNSYQKKWYLFVVVGLSFLLFENERANRSKKVVTWSVGCVASTLATENSKEGALGRSTNFMFTPLGCHCGPILAGPLVAEMSCPLFEESCVEMALEGKIPGVKKASW